MDLALVQQFPADRLPCSALEEDIVGNNDRRAAVLLQQGFNVLEEVELFVGSRGPEVVPLDDFLFPRYFAVIRQIVVLLFLPKGGFVITIS